jgi:hypothetical protein
MADPAQFASAKDQMELEIIDVITELESKKNLFRQIASHIRNDIQDVQAQSMLFMHMVNFAYLLEQANETEKCLPLLRRVHSSPHPRKETRRRQEAFCQKAQRSFNSSESFLSGEFIHPPTPTPAKKLGKM